MPIRKHGSAAEAAAAMGQLARAPKERQDEFYLLIGYCIAGWAHVDEALFQVFAQCVSPYEQAAIIYYRTPGLDVRLKLTDELVRSLLPKRERKSGGHDHEYVKSWKEIFDTIDKLLGTRRLIAHQRVEMKQIENMLLLFVRPDLFGDDLYRIYANPHERIRAKESDATPLMLSDLKNHIRDINDAGEVLKIFREKLIAHMLTSRGQDLPQGSP